LIELLRTVRRNRSVQERQIALYELGRVWPGEMEGDLPLEEERLAVVLSGGWLGREWHTEPKDFDVYDLLGVLEDLRDGLRLPGYEPVTAEHASLMPGQSMVVRAGGAPLGIAGTLHPDVADAFGIEDPVFVAELEVGALVGASTRAAEYSPAPRFPAVERDLAVLVGEGITVGDLVATARAAGVPLLAEVEVFDVYRGAGISADKKSVALGLMYRHAERTLTDAEVDEIHAQVERALSDAHGAVRR
jgi:phenylalanyl-tRNA synthetase beta chain